MNTTAAHNHAADFTGFDKLRYLDFIVTGSGSARAVWSSDNGVGLAGSALVLPERRLVVRRIQTNIQAAVSVVGGSGTASIAVDLVQPPSATGSANVVSTISVLTLNAKTTDPLVDLYVDQLTTYLPQIRFKANSTIGTPTGWTGQIRARIGYQMVHKFDDLPDSTA